MAADRAVMKAVRPHRRAKPTRTLAWYSELGDQPQMRILCGGMLLLGLARRDGRMVRAGARMLAAHTLATAAKNFIKQRVDRGRPRKGRGAKAHRPTPGGKTAKADTSFPSGHTAGAVAVGLAFARDYPEYRVPALGAAGAISLAQIPRCAHYPTDVGAGAAIGWVAEMAVSLAGAMVAGAFRPKVRAGTEPGKNTA